MTRQLGGRERPADTRRDGSTTVHTDAALTALDDEDCRALLAAAAGQARTASELIDRSGVPRSTTYRKLDDLVAAGLLEERVRISLDSFHASEYRRTVDDVLVSVSAAGDVEVGTGREGRAAD